MAVQVKTFAGELNYDDPVDVLPLNNHIDAQNIRFTGTVGNLRAENIEGTLPIPNSYLPSTGVNTTIGRYFDDVRNRTFVFNANTLGLHSIHILNGDNSWTKVVEGSVLAFDPNEPITSIDILYNDAVDGDLLYFIDSLKRPTKLNIPRYIANTYNPIKRNFLRVIKAPPAMPIKVVYENDFNVSVNNLANSLFQFIYRFVYDDLDKSVWSSGSLVPLPWASQQQSAIDNRFYNARLALYLQTGDVNIKRIEIAMRQASNTVISDWVLVDTLIKDDLGIASNGIYRYVFYNDGLYNAIDLKEQVLDFDFVPDEANCGVLLNGNVPAYAGITEGYDLIKGDMTGLSTIPALTNDVNGTLFFGIQGDDDSYGEGDEITLYLTGVGDNDATDPTLFNTICNYLVRVQDAAGSDISFSYSNAGTVGVYTTISDIFAGLQAAAIVAGFTVVGSTLNTITLSYVGCKLQMAYLQQNRAVQPSGSDLANVTNTVIYCNQYSSSYHYGVIYRDENGKTNGVITTQGLKVLTISNQTAQDFNPSQNSITINHRPPSWAIYWHLVCSPNLTYDKELTWVSKGAYSNTSSINKYAYIDISNLIDYNNNLSSINYDKVTEGARTYDFSDGDRIKFLKRYDFAQVEYPLSAKQYDYEILGVSYSIVANNQKITGVFLKIKYPAADIGSDFDFNTLNYQNYKIFVYSYSKRTSETILTYNEIGHRRKIGNAGTDTAYHIAQDQTQSPDLSTPAIENITAGDRFMRYINIPTGTKYTFVIGSTTEYKTPGLINISVPSSPITTSQYILRTQPQLALNLIGVNDVLYHNLTGATTQITFKGTIPITCPDGVTQFTMGVTTSDFAASSTFTLLLNGSVDTTLKYFDFEGTVTVPLSEPYAYLSIEPVPFTVSGHAGIFVSAFNIDVTVGAKNFQTMVIDPYFNDAYKIALTSTSRPQIVNPNAKREFKSTLLRFANPLEQGTNLNQSNRFYENNTDEFDRQWGAVIRMSVNGRQLQIFQYANTGVVGVYSKFIKDNSGSQNLITTDSIITQNNIQYYNGGFGIRNQPTGLCKNGYVYYFPDTIRGVLCRLSQDGITPISEQYKVQTWAGENLPKYQIDSNYEFGGKAKVLTVYNQLKNRHGEVIFILQQGKNVDRDTDKQPFAMVFDESRNAFTANYQFNPDQIVCMGNRLISFRNGVAFEHADTAVRCNFYNTQYKASITLSFNQYLLEKKTWEALTEIASQVWGCPMIYTNIDSYVIPNIQKQESELIEQDFKKLENDYHAAFLRDKHSIKGILRGDTLKGNYCVISFQTTAPQIRAFLSEIAVRYIDSYYTEK